MVYTCRCLCRHGNIFEAMSNDTQRLQSGNLGLEAGRTFALAAVWTKTAVLERMTRRMFV